MFNINESMNYIFRVVGIVFPFLSVLFSNCASAQNYTSYFTGDTADVFTNTIPGIVLMGGASENDSAMIWFLEQSGGCLLYTSLIISTDQYSFLVVIISANKKSCFVISSSRRKFIIRHWSSSENYFLPIGIY